MQRRRGWVARLKVGVLGTRTCAWHSQPAYSVPTSPTCWSLPRLVAPLLHWSLPRLVAPLLLSAYVLVTASPCCTLVALVTASPCCNLVALCLRAGHCLALLHSCCTGHCLAVLHPCCTRHACALLHSFPQPPPPPPPPLSSRWATSAGRGRKEAVWGGVPLLCESGLYCVELQTGLSVSGAQ